MVQFYEVTFTLPAVCPVKGKPIHLCYAIKVDPEVAKNNGFTSECFALDTARQFLQEECENVDPIEVYIVLLTRPVK